MARKASGGGNSRQASWEKKSVSSLFHEVERLEELQRKLAEMGHAEAAGETGDVVRVIKTAVDRINSKHHRLAPMWAAADSALTDPIRGESALQEASRKYMTAYRRAGR